MAKPDTGGPAYPNFSYEEDDRGKYHPGMSLLDAAALVAFREKLRTYSSDEDAAKHAYHAGEKFIAEKRRREA